MDDLRAEVKLILDMTTRVDERLKSICEKQLEVSTRLNHFSATTTDLLSRVLVLESSHEMLEDLDELKHRTTLLEATGSPAYIQAQKEINSLFDSLTTHITNLDRRLAKVEESNKGFWVTVNKITQMVTHAIWVIVVCYLLMRLNLVTPPIP